MTKDVAVRKDYACHHRGTRDEERKDNYADEVNVMTMETRKPRINRRKE